MCFDAEGLGVWGFGPQGYGGGLEFNMIRRRSNFGYGSKLQSQKSEVL